MDSRTVVVTSPSIPINKMKRQLQRHQKSISPRPSAKTPGFHPPGQAVHRTRHVRRRKTELQADRGETDGRNEEMRECTVRLRADGWVKVLQRLLCGSGGTDRCGVPLRPCNLQRRCNRSGNEKHRQSKRVKAPEAELGLVNVLLGANCRGQGLLLSERGSRSARLAPAKMPNGGVKGLS